MKIKTSISVVIRILLWLIMLIGGAYYSISKDIDNYYFNNIYFHTLYSDIWNNFNLSII